MILSLVVASLTPAPLLPPDEVVLTAPIEERTSGEGEMPPVGPRYESLSISEEAPEGAPTLGAEVHGASWAKLEVAGKPVFVVIGRTAPDVEALDVAWLDRDADGSFGEGERIGLEPSAREMNDGSVLWSQDLAGLALEVGGAKLPITLSYFLHPTRGVGARVVFEGWQEARVTVDGKELAVAMLDLDYDGCVGGAEDRWTLYAVDSPPERPESPYGLNAFDEGRFQDGRRYSVKVDGCQTLHVTAATAAGPDPHDLERHRVRIEKLWSDRFDEEREGFVAARELDESRPRATAPIAWKYVSYEQALALGEETGKPVFIDVMAFWCVWCYRMDYYTYVDAEVAKMLNESFVPVKIIQEQAVEGDYDLVMREKLEARGIPAMGIFDAEGNVLHTIGGWKKPEEFLEDLRAGLEAFEGEGN